MTLTYLTGPLVVQGQTGSVTSGAPPADYNSDAGPSAFAMGVMMLAPGLPAGVNLGFYQNNEVPGINQAPATLGGANIVALANVTSGTAMTLAAASTGITVLASALVTPNGRTVPAGCLVLDGNPATITYGTSGSMQAFDPRTLISRAVSVTGVASGTGGAFSVKGFDIYGAPMTETITAGAGINTVNGKKAFKFIQSVTPGFSDAHNYSFGTTNIFGFPLAVYDFGAVELTWDAIDVTSNTGFVAAVTTSPATATTGDVRGTYAVQGNAADGTRKLIATISVAPWNVANANGAASLFGVSQFGG